ncbi:MAG TPA: hypothetical protein VGK36_21660 [Candidatus Angelobacter sp.]|jgi:hypothetical protein
MTKQHSGNSSASNWLLALVLLVMFFVLSTGLLSAAEAPRIQVFGGYTRMQFDSKAFGFNSDTGLNGGTIGGAFNLAPYFGVKTQISIATGPNVRSRDWAIGPQGMYSKWGVLFFGHVLFGKAETRLHVPNVVEEDNARATILGGGVDIPIARRISIRAIQVDYLRTKPLGVEQNDVKFTTGVVFHLGRLSTRPKHKL